MADNSFLTLLGSDVGQEIALPRFRYNKFWMSSEMISCFCSVVVITLASHARGHRFEPGQKHTFWPDFRSVQTTFCLIYWYICIASCWQSIHFWLSDGYKMWPWAWRPWGRLNRVGIKLWPTVTFLARKSFKLFWKTEIVTPSVALVNTVRSNWKEGDFIVDYKNKFIVDCKTFFYSRL